MDFHDKFIAPFYSAVFADSSLVDSGSSWLTPKLVQGYLLAVVLLLQ